MLKNPMRVFFSCKKAFSGITADSSSGLILINRQEEREVKKILGSY